MAPELGKGPMSLNISGRVLFKKDGGIAPLPSLQGSPPMLKGMWPSLVQEGEPCSLPSMDAKPMHFIFFLINVYSKFIFNPYGALGLNFIFLLAILMYITRGVQSIRSLVWGLL